MYPHIFIHRFNLLLCWPWSGLPTAFPVARPWSLLMHASNFLLDLRWMTGPRNAAWAVMVWATPLSLVNVRSQSMQSSAILNLFKKTIWHALTSETIRYLHFTDQFVYTSYNYIKIVFVQAMQDKPSGYALRSIHDRAKNCRYHAHYNVWRFEIFQRLATTIKNWGILTFSFPIFLMVYI